MNLTQINLCVSVPSFLKGRSKPSAVQPASSSDISTTCSCERGICSEGVIEFNMSQMPRLHRDRKANSIADQIRGVVGHRRSISICEQQSIFHCAVISQDDCINSIEWPKCFTQSSDIQYRRTHHNFYIGLATDMEMRRGLLADQNKLLRRKHVDDIDNVLLLCLGQCDNTISLV